MHILARAIRLLLRAAHIPLALLHRVIFALFSKHWLETTAVLAMSCLCAGLHDLARGRRIDALLWAGVGACVFLGFLCPGTLPSLVFPGTPSGQFAGTASAALGAVALIAGIYLAMRQVRRTP